MNTAVILAIVMTVTAGAKELRDEPKRAEEMGLSEDELAFYDALAQSKSAVEVLGDAQLRAIACDLVKSVRESVRAGIRLKIKKLFKKLLRKHGYPPDVTERAADQVLEQAKLLCQTPA